MKKRTRRNYLRITLALVAALTVCGALALRARTASLMRGTAATQADGDLDPSFGVGGRVVPGQFSGFDSIYDTVVQPDGKIVVAGESDFSFVLARYDAVGHIDPAFGTGGVVRTPTPGWAPSGDGRKGERLALALQADGKIVLGGTVLGSGVAGRVHPSLSPVLRASSLPV